MYLCNFNQASIATDDSSVDHKSEKVDLENVFKIDVFAFFFSSAVLLF